MSIQAVAWALDQDIRDPFAKLILISLGNHADHSTGFCYPAMRLIAKEASCDRRTVIRKLPSLSDSGYIRIIPDRQGKQRLAHYYQLLTLHFRRSNQRKGLCKGRKWAALRGPPEKGQRSFKMP